MKKLLFLLLIITGIANAQIVNIPDAAFKAKLLSANSSNQIASTDIPVYIQANDVWTVTSYVTIDANGDGEIQVSEAQAIKYLNISSSNIVILSGLESFIQLICLKCIDNLINTLDVNSINIQALFCSSNNLINFNVSNCPNLKFLDCFDNNLTTINIASNSNLLYLKCAYNSISSLNVQNNINLIKLICFENDLVTLDISNNQALNYLHCASNQLTSINVAQNVNLETLRCSNNSISNIDLTTNINLWNLECYNNLLSSLNVTNNTNINWLTCSNNTISSIDLSQNIQLTHLVISNNSLASLDVSNNINLLFLYCENNNLLDLDLTNNPKIFTLKCYNNSLSTINVSNMFQMLGLECGSLQLNTIFMKNGKNETLTISNAPNLQYVCADESQVSSIQAQAGPNVMVSSYCSFTPGGTYNTVSGTVRFDMNNNGCDASDSAFPNSVHLNIAAGAVSSGTFPTTDGSYLLYTLTGSNVLTSSLENPSYFTITPTSTTITTTTLGNTQTQDFCISANGVHNDVEVIIVPIRWARPGFDAEYKIVYKNKGNQMLSGDVNFNYNDAVLDYVLSSLNPNTQSTGNLTWNYTNLLPFESRSFNIVLNVNAPTETPAVNIGDVLNFNATINPVSGDETTVDNVFTYNQNVVGAYDPNDKTCLEGAIVSSTKIGDYLHYNINFENTGNAAAQNIVVKDIFDVAKFDLYSLQIMNSSHPMATKISSNKLEFVFQDINLGASQHGNVTFKIKTLSFLPVGSSVTNKADIYFDYNFPVATNTATTTFQTLSSGEFELDNSVKVYPNPAKNNININCNSTIKSIELFDIQGRILTTKIVDDSISNFDISNYSNGVYFVKITTENGSKVEKVIKE